MSAFWKFLLRASLPKDVLSGMCFAVFGLGDSRCVLCSLGVLGVLLFFCGALSCTRLLGAFSLVFVCSYAKFNATSRKLNARLLQLGAVPLVDRGLGDEQSPLGIDGDLDAWLPLLWEAVLRRWPLPADHIINDAPVQQRPNFTVMLHPADELPVLAVRDAAEVLPADSPPPSCFSFTAPRGCYSLGFVATVVQNTRITSPDWKQDVRHIVFQVGDHAYAAGDIALIMPQNVGDGCELVNRLLARLRLKPMDVLSIGSTDDYRCWDASPAVVTAFDLVRSRASFAAATSQCMRKEPPDFGIAFHYSIFYVQFTKYLDVLSIPKRSLLEQLSFYAADAEQAEKCAC